MLPLCASWRWAPAGIIVFAVVADLLAHRWVSAAPLLSVAPLTAAPSNSAYRVVTAGAASMAAWLYLSWVNGTLDVRGDGVVGLTLTLITAVAVAMNRALARQRASAGEARHTARVAQEAVLPRPPSRLGGLRVAVRYVPADEAALIGGDLFVAQETPAGVRAMIADVRGKGLNAVAAVAADLGAFRHAADHSPDLPSLAHEMENALSREGDRHGGLEQTEGFTTALLIEVPPDLESVRILNRGHPAPLLLLPPAQVEQLDPPVEAPPLGMTGLGSWPAPVTTHRLPPGAMLLCFTDGITEARDPAGNFYDAPTRLAHLLRTHHRDSTEPTPGQVLDFLTEDVRHHSAGPAQDDQALMTLQRPRPTPPPPRPSSPEG
ncbi:PP2C family protein-serine/threonine phosphatase [Streptomyces cacaoi]|uniref:PP2C family protein-serine/threonine phosphatase n=1 Tax=Streptomyces cacaoi TaxID=1898 RepID=UPI002624ECC8|nr:PP2C family protein-serine/threonine phosphatase [Streptomyces cacaoi]